MTSLLALHRFTNYIGTCLGGVLLALLRLAHFGTCLGECSLPVIASLILARRSAVSLARYRLATFGTCLDGVLLARHRLANLGTVISFAFVIGKYRSIGSTST